MAEERHVAVGPEFVPQRVTEQLQLGNAAFAAEPAKNFGVIDRLHVIDNVTEILADGKPMLRRWPVSTLIERLPANIFYPMTNLQQVEQAVLNLSDQEQEELRDWLENLLEDRLEMTDEFKAEIAAGKADIAAGRVRTRRP